MNSLLFCGCAVHRPLRAAPAWRRAFRDTPYRGISLIHTYAQTLQVIEILKGQRTIPRELLFACHVSPTVGPVEGADTFSDVDLVMLETSTPVELAYRGHQLHAFAINHKICKAIFGDNAVLKRAADLWRKGLYEFNDAVRAEGAAQILKQFEGSTGRDALVRSIVEETRSQPCDVRSRLCQLREIFPGPMAIVLRHFQYFADGRVIDWPDWFTSEVRRVAEDLRIPVFDPAAEVQQFGPGRAIGPDGAHYSNVFEPVIGAALTEFALSAVRPG
jgi:hypothetical protein